MSISNSKLSPNITLDTLFFPQQALDAQKHRPSKEVVGTTSRICRIMRGLLFSSLTLRSDRFSVFQRPTFTCFFGYTNGLQITMADTITLNVATTLTYVTESTDPSNWLLRNVYANGTTQIGGVQSGTGTASFTFQSPGPHFLQAVAYNDSTSAVTSQPFYTGNLFTPVSSPGASSSAASASSTSCPSSYSSGSTSPNVGAIAGGVIGGLGFLSALIFFVLWFRLRRDYNRKPNFGQAVKEANGGGVVLTPIIVPPYQGPPPTQAASTSISPTSTTDLSSPISRLQGTIKRRLPEVPMSGVATGPMDSATSPGSQSQSTFPSSYSQHAHADSVGEGGVVRELSDLRREVQWLRNDIHGPPPSY
ncbi:hypothetical protein EV368DRAFT_63505 [Lentinula lateritia]|uniref:Uncharacterized protein n=1 Tax=Lentinula aff. lateritia TaxID=2804960 RepID=A0ACC1UDN6_9AGAR|nr:hypothetical protein F5876DRAFT_61842 [Lentinula aff. lateritia]KAJ3854175.1 hypothetical protein EV368DRAFT_63505 [Lentinula lateritia]